MIKNLRLQRFKKFSDMTISFRPFTVLMGENSCGKTSVLQALNLALLSLHSYELVTTNNGVNPRVRRRGVGLQKLPGFELADYRELYYAKVSRSARSSGTVGCNIVLNDTSENCYKLQISSLFGGFNIKCNSSPDDVKNSPKLQNKPPLFISGFVGLSSAEERILPVALTDRLRSGHVSTVIRNLVYDTRANAPEQYEKLRKRLARDFDFHLDSVLFDAEKDLYVTAQYSEVCYGKSLSLDFNASGSGFMQILQILAPLYRFCPKHSDVVLLDEPDAHLHPNLQTTLANSLRNIQKELGIQIIISTHSTSIIRAASPSEVVPITTAGSECKPLTNSEEIEDQIKTTIDSYNLAKSVISGKLLFFEDSDISLWERFDEILNTKVFKGATTAPIITGRGKTDRVPFHIKQVLESFLETDVEVHFIRDRDGIPDEWEKKLLKFAEEKGVVVSILDYFELENYLLNPELVLRAIKTKHGGKPSPSQSELHAKIQTLLKNTIILAKYNYDDCLEDELYQLGLLMNLSEYRNQQTVKAEVRTLRNDLENLDGLENLQKHGMGKEALKELFSWLNDLGLNLNKSDIVNVITPKDIPQSITSLFAKLKSKEHIADPSSCEPLVIDDSVDEIETRTEELLFNFE